MQVAINMTAVITKFEYTWKDNLNYVETSAGQSLYFDKTGNQGKEIEIGMTVEDFILKCRPVVWGSQAQFYGVRTKDYSLHSWDSNEQTRVRLVEELEYPNYKVFKSEGKGYSGGHVSQSDYHTYEGTAKEGAEFIFDQTWSGNTGGYYPLVISMTKIVKQRILVGHKDLAGKIPVYREMAIN